MNKHITLATCCLLLISMQALADRPAMSERTEIIEPEEVDISTSTDHRPATEAVNEAATIEDNTEVEARPEKEPVIRVYNRTTDTEVKDDVIDEQPEVKDDIIDEQPEAKGDVIEVQPDSTLPVRVLDFPRRGMNMEKVKNELGQPLKVSPAVGTPPITRWTYSDRIVYFEYSSVVHVVALP